MEKKVLPVTSTGEQLCEMATTLHDQGWCLGWGPCSERAPCLRLNALNCCFKIHHETFISLYLHFADESSTVALVPRLGTLAHTRSTCLLFSITPLRMHSPLSTSSPHQQPPLSCPSPWGRGPRLGMVGAEWTPRLPPPAKSKT
jgi:hypothetical protein